MTRKTFFRERTASQIKALNPRQVYTQRNLVQKIDDLAPNEALELRTQIIPGRFFIGGLTPKQASRKAYKHGDLITLSHPQTQRECYASPEIPLAIRARDFSELETLPEEEINFVGYSMQPRWGDRTKRIFPFVWMPEGIRLFGYAENMTSGIKVDIYPDASRVKREGATVVAEVPSRTRKNPRYKFKLLHIPIKRGIENLATILTFKPAVLQDEKTGEPIQGRTAHDVYNIRYTWGAESEGSEVITLYPQDLAAYLAVVKAQIANHNMTPMEMNPFALSSRHQADFYRKLCNSLLVFDPSPTTKHKTRKPHIAEKSILLARAIGAFGHDDFSFWDPGRDGKLRDYDWSIPE